MMWRSFVPAWLSALASGPARSGRPGQVSPRQRFRPRLEALEDRLAPAIVFSTPAAGLMALIGQISSESTPSDTAVTIDCANNDAADNTESDPISIEVSTETTLTCADVFLSLNLANGAAFFSGHNDADIVIGLVPVPILASNTEPLGGHHASAV